MKVSDGIGHRPPAQDRGQRHAVRAPGHGQPGLFRMAAQCTVLRNPDLNQVPLHARQQALAVVQRQAQRIEGRMGVGVATSGNFMGLLRPVSAVQLDRHPPFHPHPRSSRLRS
jgi:hypothetical protein